MTASLRSASGARDLARARRTGRLRVSVRVKECHRLDRGAARRSPLQVGSATMKGAVTTVWRQARDARVVLRFSVGISQRCAATRHASVRQSPATRAVPSSRGRPSALRAGAPGHLTARPAATASPIGHRTKVSSSSRGTARARLPGTSAAQGDFGGMGCVLACSLTARRVRRRPVTTPRPPASFLRQWTRRRFRSPRSRHTVVIPRARSCSGASLRADAGIRPTGRAAI